MGIQQVYTNSGYVYTIGGIPVGSGSVTPPPPPEKVTLSIGGQPGLASASAMAWRNPSDILPYASILWTDETAQATGLDYGSLVAIRISSAPYYTVGTPEISGLSALGVSASPVDTDGSYVYMTGYITADTVARMSGSAQAKTFTASYDGIWGGVVTGSGGGGTANDEHWPFVRDFRTAGNFKSSFWVTRRTSYLGATATVFEPLECSAVSMTSVFNYNVVDNPGWGPATAAFRFNFSGGTTWNSTSTPVFSARISANVSQAIINSLSTKTETSNAMGHSARFWAPGSKQTGNFEVKLWSATGIAK